MIPNWEFPGYSQGVQSKIIKERRHMNEKFNDLVVIVIDKGIVLKHIQIMQTSG